VTGKSPGAEEDLSPSGEDGLSLRDAKMRSLRLIWFVVEMVSSYYQMVGTEGSYIVLLLTLSIEPSLWALSQSAGETTKDKYDDKGRSSPECECY